MEERFDPLAPDDLHRRKAVGILVLVGVLWSLGGLLIKSVAWHPLAIAGARSFIAALVTLLILRRPRFNRPFIQIAGAFTYAGTVILFVTANKLTTAANAILLQYTAPIYVGLFGAWFLGERTTWRDWAASVVVVGGIALFFCDDLTVAHTWGNVCALGSGLCLAWTVLFLRKQGDGSSFEFVILGNLIAAVVGLPFILMDPPDLSILAGVTVLGVVQLGLPYALYVVASRHVTALDLILIPALEPILNPLWVLLFAGEVPGPLALVGGLIVLTAVTLRGVFARRYPPLPTGSS